MNFTTSPVLYPLRVLVTNPLTQAAQMIITKILSGEVFGEDQLIDLILLVYSNEKPDTETFKISLKKCAFSCMNSIEVSSDLPNITEADVFCFITTLKNPNHIDFENIDVDQFDALYLIIKIANHLVVEPVVAEPEVVVNVKKKKDEPKPKLPPPRKPIIFTDGLVTMDILNSLSKNIPFDYFFCPSPLIGIAKSVLAEYLKVDCNALNRVSVWAINDVMFHVEVDTPLIIETEDDCSTLEKKNNNFDHTQFNESWMKKDFIERILKFSSNNPYGDIFKAHIMASDLSKIWRIRLSKGEKYYHSMGVISDGTMGTIKGCPYILPLVFEDDNFSVNTFYKECSHVGLELKIFNDMEKTFHKQLKAYCKKFLEENVISLKFAQLDDTATSYSFNDSNSSLNVQQLI